MKRTPSGSPVRARASWIPGLGLGGLVLLLAATAQSECSPSALQSAEQNYSTAYQFVINNQWEEAVPSLEGAIEACPEHWPSVELMAQAKGRLKAWDQSAALYQELIDGQYGGSNDLAELRVLHGYGLALLQTQKWVEAEAVYEAVLRQDPSDANAHERLVYAYDKSGNTDEAIEHLVALYELAEGEEQQGKVAIRIGEAYKKAGNSAAAAEWYAKSGSPSAGMFTIGLEHMKAGRYAEAADAFSAYIEGNKESVNAYKNLAACQLKLNRVSDAIVTLEQATAIAPQRHDVAADLGFRYLDAERWVKAGTIAQDAVDDWPDDDPYKGRMYYLMGKVLEKRDANYEAAISMFEKALGDPVVGDKAEDEIARQKQLIQIRDMKAQQGR